MFDRLKCWKFSDGGPIAGQLVCTDRFWNVEFTEQVDQKRSRSFSITVALQQDVKHDPMLVYGPPQPGTDTADSGTEFRPCATGNPDEVPGDAGSSAMSGENLMFHSRSVSWLTSTPRSWSSSFTWLAVHWTPAFRTSRRCSPARGHEYSGPDGLGQSLLAPAQPVCRRG